MDGGGPGLVFEFHVSVRFRCWRSKFSGMQKLPREPWEVDFAVDEGLRPLKVGTMLGACLTCERSERYEGAGGAGPATDVYAGGLDLDVCLSSRPLSPYSDLCI